MHILYLIHDLVHHTKVRGGDNRVAIALEPVLEGLFGLTAQGKGVKHGKKIGRLLHLWSARDYFPSSTIDTLRDTVGDARRSENAGTVDVKAAEGDQTEKTQREKPFDLPATHGDYNTAWYDLPAASLMQHIIPNSTKPIKGSLVQPLHFQPGPADTKVAEAVKNLILDSKKLYGEEKESEEAKWDIDELGQRVVKDSRGAKKMEETYYGWSEEFAVKMARKKKGLVPILSREDRDDRAYSSDRSMSRSRSRSRGGNGRGGNGIFGGGSRGSYSRSISRSRSTSRGQNRGYGVRGGGYGGAGGMGPPRGRGSRSATPEGMMPRGLGY